MSASPLSFIPVHLHLLPTCYCATQLCRSSGQGGEPLLLVAAEQDYPCYVINMSGQAIEKLWHSPGGVMSLVQLPDGDGRTILATQEFYGPDTSERAKIVVAKACTSPPPPGCHLKDSSFFSPRGAAPVLPGWRRFVLAEMPFVHRIDVLPSGDGKRRFLMACTLKTGQQHQKDDWSQPGKVMAAELPPNIDDLLPPSFLDLADGSPVASPLVWRVLRENCLKNHGYCRHRDASTGVINALIGWEDGLFQFTPPRATEDDWDIRQLTSDPTSDGVMVDLDGDGLEEIVAISPFHGDCIRVYHLNAEGQYQLAAQFPDRPFAHAIWGGCLSGRNVAVVGHRSGARDLLLLTYSLSAGYTLQVIAKNTGPANVIPWRSAATAEEPPDSIISCDRETHTVTLYLVKK